MSYLRILIVLCLLTAFTICPADAESIPAKTLTRLKAATPFLKVALHGRKQQGTGFLIYRKGRTGFLVTNEHVVRQGKRRATSITAVFHSGTEREVSVPAKVVAVDGVFDLAILELTMDDMPDPIELSKTTAVRETLPVYIVGYPFGEALASGERGPGVTISKGTIASIRRDKWGLIQALQLDCSVNPGNSGGPIVRENGDLLGVAVAKVSGTQIGFAIPPVYVKEIIKGRVAEMSCDKVKTEGSNVLYRVTAEVADPHGHVSNARLMVADYDLSEKTVRHNEDGSWEAISPILSEHVLERTPHGFCATVMLTGNRGEGKRYRFQVRYTRGDEEPVYSGTASLTVVITDHHIGRKPKPRPSRLGSHRKSFDFGYEGPPTEPAVDGDWLVLFRSAEPRIWDSSCDRDGHFAVAVSKVPDGVKYLRMRRMDTKEFVIIPMSTEEISDERNTTLGAYGWASSNRPKFGGVRLGIFRPDWESGHGDINISSPKMGHGNRGWGFGVVMHRSRDGQAYGWKGEILSEPLTLEIAVTCKELPDDERKRLLR